MKVLMVCSSGGHLRRLLLLQPWWKRHERRWVTFQTPDAISLLAAEEVDWAFHPVTRNLPNALRNLRLAWRLLRENRPDVVVSSGAGVAVPFFVAARLLRIPTVFLEGSHRIDSRSLTGRLCYPLTDLFLLQSDQQRKMYPRGVVVGHIL